MSDARRSPLLDVLTEARQAHGCSMNDLTVLAPQNDPFRVDTPARHRDGEWLATTARDLELGDRKIHLRGLHYMLIGRPKPDGTPYTNTDADWLWLSSDAGKAARWLGYISFDQIVDQRNTAPEITRFTKSAPWPYINVGIEVEIPDEDDLVPRVGVSGFDGAQLYKIVFFGEKSSLADVLAPLAREYHADLYLPTGEISDTLLYKMAVTGADDGRPMVVFTFSDADPAGWQMPISIGRKLQAFQAYGEIDVPHENSFGYSTTRTVDLGSLDFQVQRVALTPDQVRTYGLPSTPLKSTELRADRWRSAMGVAQTEIDALASLQPTLLREIARDAISPFFDSTLDRRVRTAENEWRRHAQQIVDAALDDDHLREMRADAAEKLDQMRAQVDEINDALRIDTDRFELPEPVVPEPQINGDHPFAIG